MAVIPAGSLVFTGYGDPDGTKPKFLSDAGINVGTPVTDPLPGAQGWASGIIQLPDGVYFCSGLNNPGPDFASSATYDSEWNLLGFDAGPSSVGAACNYNNGFYILLSTGGFRKIRRFNTSCGIVQTWSLLVSTNYSAIGVAPDDSIAYFTKHSGIGANVVKRWDLVNDVALSDLVTEAGATSGNPDNGVLVLQDGTILVGWQGVGIGIKRYDTSGSLLNTYTMLDNGSDFFDLTPAEDETSFFVSWYAVDTSFTNVARIRTSDGVVLSVFQISNSSGFFYDGPFAMLQVPVLNAINPSPPANETCAGAIDVSVPDTIAPDTTAANQGEEPDNSCGTGDSWNSLWYHWQGTSLITKIGVQAANNDGNNVITVFSGACGSLVEEGCVLAPDSITIDVTDGVDYYFMLTSITPGGMLSQEMILTDETPVGPTGQFCTTFSCVTISGSGIYQLVRDKKNDTIYVSVDNSIPPNVVTRNVKIP